MLHFRGAKVPPIFGRKHRYFLEVLNNRGKFSWSLGPQKRRFRATTALKTCLQHPSAALVVSNQLYITLNFASQTPNSGHSDPKIVV